LQFLAERLKLPLEELEVLAQQHRESEVEPQQFRSLEDLHKQATLLLNKKEAQKAIDLFTDVPLPQIPALQRWRLVALRGQCYFEQKQFLKALQDFLCAINAQPKLDSLSTEQKQELMLLHLRLACVYRILDLDGAREEYQAALGMMSGSTPSGYAAEAYWGLAIIAYMQAYKQKGAEFAKEKKEHLLAALGYADDARRLYHSVGEKLCVAAVTCQIAQIEKELGHQEEVRTSMQELLKTWGAVLQEPEATRAEAQQHQKERANIVSAAASTLAHLAFKTRDYEHALEYVATAIQAGARSNKIRQADAYILHGCILEALNGHNSATEDAFRQAIALLATTERMTARINAHNFLCEYLLKQGKHKEAQQELEIARSLSLQVEESTVIAQTNMPQ
jgi:tetratricopeptide (TPR) repeat protein